MKNTRALSFIIIILASLLITAGYIDAHRQTNTAGNNAKSQFYVGVTFCGNTTAQAELLIDRVKTYTNLFVLSNSPVTRNETSATQVCDYATAGGLNIIINLGTANNIDFSNFNFTPNWSWQYHWLDTAKQRWGNKFLGVYYYDEPGGTHMDAPWPINASNVKILDYINTTDFFEWVYKNDTGLTTLKAKGIPVFTSDYVLYWFDYLLGYDVILGELGWNQSTVQTIAMTRGAATMQNKDWGVTITWRYNGTGYNDIPYLDTGDAIYQQMLTAYEAGAKYALIFNYPTYPPNNPYGIMMDEHFDALKRLWNDVNALSPEAHGSLKAEAALILPHDYGWGMRRADDKIWGAWGPDEKSPQIWSISRELLAHYGFGLDIIYEDSAFPFAGKYPTVYYWNETFTGGERKK